MSFIKKYWTNGFNLFRIRLFLSISTYVMQFCIIAATFLRFLFAKNMHAQNHKKELWECSHILTNPNIGNCNVTIGFSPPPKKKYVTVIYKTLILGNQFVLTITKIKVFVKESLLQDINTNSYKQLSLANLAKPK